MINCRGKTSESKHKTQVVKVRLLDDKELQLQIGPKTTGFDLFDSVCTSLNLIDRSYFGLRVVDTTVDQRWLDNRKTVISQTMRKLFAFAVKFYCPDPSQLDDEYTRYLFALQIKKDLGNGTLKCCDSTANLLASLIAQAEIGDYLSDYDDEGTYLNHRIFYPSQTTSSQIALNHKKYIGQSPAKADIHLLNIARRTEFYGLHPAPARDAEGNLVGLCASHSGLLVLQDLVRVNTFTWVLIRKIGFKRKKLLIKLQPDKYGYYNETLEFFFAERDQCKQFWMLAIENHGFFRCDSRAETGLASTAPANKKTSVSSHRYTGLTMKESIYRTREMRLGGRLSGPDRFERFYAGTRRTRRYQPSEAKSSVFRSQTSHLKNDDKFDTFVSPRKSINAIDSIPTDSDIKSTTIKQMHTHFHEDNVTKSVRGHIFEHDYQLDEHEDSSFTDFEVPHSDVKLHNNLSDRANIKSRINVLSSRIEALSLYSSSEEQTSKRGRLKSARDVADIVRIDRKFIPEVNTYSMHDDTVSPAIQTKFVKEGKTTRTLRQPAIFGTSDAMEVNGADDACDHSNSECVNQSGNLGIHQ